MRTLISPRRHRGTEKFSLSFIQLGGVLRGSVSLW